MGPRGAFASPGSSRDVLLNKVEPDPYSHPVRLALAARVEIREATAGRSKELHRILQQLATLRVPASTLGFRVKQSRQRISGAAMRANRERHSRRIITKETYTMSESASREMPVNATLQKPFSVQEFQQAVAGLLTEELTHV